MKIESIKVKDRGSLEVVVNINDERIKYLARMNTAVLSDNKPSKEFLDNFGEYERDEFRGIVRSVLEVIQKVEENNLIVKKDEFKYTRHKEAVDILAKEEYLTTEGDFIKASEKLEKILRESQ
ncbi:MAG: hypothetical protein H0Z28_12710 [Archaeoglobus sp.]|nr:hypothetical protein [Archaeoglobus sp.]